MATKSKFTLPVAIAIGVIIVVLLTSTSTQGSTAKFSAPWQKYCMDNRDCSLGYYCSLTIHSDKGQCLLKYDLASYPNPFVSVHGWEGMIVIGADAPPSDQIAATAIAAGLNLQQGVTPAKLDTQITAQDKQGLNLILVGSELDNRLIADVAGKAYNKKFADYYSTMPPAGFGYIQLKPSKYNQEYYAMLIVRGKTAKDTRYAADILKNFTTYQASGKLFGINCKAYANGNLECSY